MVMIKRMKGQDYVDKTREYLDYLEEHIENVRLSFINLSKICDGMRWVGDDGAWHSIRQSVIDHDLSKFSAEEFVQYRNSFFAVDGEAEDKIGFDSAWEHHKYHNHHHHETIENHLDVVLMVIDWTAMGYKFGDTAQQYYEANSERIELSGEHKKTMYEMFAKIAEAE